jgi:hypothetical protein
MDSRPRPDEAAEATGEHRVTAHESRPGRTVFTEEGNSDAWIATDLTLDAEP